MAGPAAEVHISPKLAIRPKAWDLTTPNSAVQSYLDWTSFSFRTAQSSYSTATMSPNEGVRVDAYIQFNLEKKQIIDQTLTSITFGTPKVETSSTLVPTKEQWRYSYLSIEPGNKVIGGPYTASYDATYTVVKSKSGWVVDSVNAKPHGTVK